MTVILKCGIVENYEDFKAGLGALDVITWSGDYVDKEGKVIA